MSDDTPIPGDDRAQRKPISRRLRFEILRRDAHTCRYCGASAPDAKLTVDHVIPVALGGTDDSTNLVAACRDCNAGKSSIAPDSPIVDGVNDDAIRWAAAIRRAAEIVESHREQVRAFADDFYEEHWTRWGIGEGDDRTLIPLPDGWRNSIGRFAAAGLELADLGEAVDIMGAKSGVLHSDRFRYFCGVCWRMVEERQRMAAEIVRADV